MAAIWLVLISFLPYGCLGRLTVLLCLATLMMRNNIVKRRALILEREVGKTLVILLFGISLIVIVSLGGLRSKNSGTYGGGEPCYYPITRQADDSCK